MIGYRVDSVGVDSGANIVTFNVWTPFPHRAEEIARQSNGTITTVTEDQIPPQALAAMKRALSEGGRHGPVQ